MRITKIEIVNFKSIEYLSFDINKNGNSFTKMLLGINESGKSNILEAFSLFKPTDEAVNYSFLHNLKDHDNSLIEIKFHLDLDESFSDLKDKINAKIEAKRNLRYKIENIIKTVSLAKDETTFTSNYEYDVKIPENVYFYKRASLKTGDSSIILDTEKEGYTEEWNSENFISLFNTGIQNYFIKNEPETIFWEPSEKYLLKTVDLNVFKTTISSHVPLKHIFNIAGYNTEESIIREIEKISEPTHKRRLESLLSDKTTEYIKNIWNNSVKFDVSIEGSICTVLVVDAGDENKFEFFELMTRSDGFKQFISIILSLSVEVKKLNKRNALILIDEPEVHLHPSGIRELRKELIAIGENNQIFISTHSPFMIDRDCKERNIIIKKNKKAITEKKEIKEEEDMRDDEVLQKAFGINIYKDLLLSKRLLVEGKSDRVIIQKALKAKKTVYGITNGNGSNIDKIASMLNDDDIEITVLLDDDKDGKLYKKKILNISGIYNENNVFTIRDLVGDIENNGTIEDTLSKEYVLSIFNRLFNNKFSESSGFNFEEGKPMLIQIILFLKKKERYSKEFVDDFKTLLSDTLSISKNTLSTKFPLLDQLADKIISSLQ